MSDHTISSPSAELHVCAACASSLVHIVDGTESAPGVWELTLRCPECSGVRTVPCTRDGLTGLERELCRGIAEIQQELDRMVRESFEDFVERFVRALEADAILPMDFGIPG
jgi:hypothetical protein